MLQVKSLITGLALFGAMGAAQASSLNSIDEPQFMSDSALAEIQGAAIAGVTTANFQQFKATVMLKAVRQSFSLHKNVSQEAWVAAEKALARLKGLTLVTHTQEYATQAALAAYERRYIELVRLGADLKAVVPTK